MKLSPRILALLVGSGMVAAGLSACYQMGDLKDIAACQAFAAAQSAYDSAANDAIAHPDDKAKQAQWLGAWALFGPGLSGAAGLPTDEKLKADLNAYAKVVTDAGPGASPSTQLEIWNKGYAKKIVTLCADLAAPIEITELKP
jgi:hypothetical protein